MTVSEIGQKGLRSWKDYEASKVYETEWDYVNKMPSKKYVYRDGFVEGYTNCEADMKAKVKKALDALYSGGNDSEMMDACESILKEILGEDI